MEELVQLVSDKTGLPKDKAKTAVETVIDYLKKNLPDPIAQQVDKALSGAGGADVEGLAKGLGGILGKK